MIQKDFFKRNYYEGVFSNDSDRFADEAINIPTLNMAEKIELNQCWGNVWKAIKLLNDAPPSDVDSYFVGAKSNQIVIEEKLINEAKSYFVVLSKVTRDLKCFSATFTEEGAYALSREKATDFDNSLVVLAYLFMLQEQEPFQTHLEVVSDMAKKEFINTADWSETEKDLYIVNIGYIKYTLAKEIPFKNFENYQKVTEKEMEKILESEYTRLCGTKDGNHIKPKTVKKKKTDALVYSFDENKFLIPKPENWITPEKARTPEELSKIPQIEKINVTALAKKYYNAIMNTYSVAFRNFYLLGGAGIGKSTMCRLLAFMLGLPYSDTTCYAEMEMTDILGGVFPINADEENQREISEDIYQSVYDDIGVSLSMLRDETSYSLAYEVLTGTVKEGVTQEEVFSLFVKKVSEKIAEKIPRKKEEGIVYKYVPSELVKSISAEGIGGVHEIKEPTVIRNEGVLVGLNTLLAEGTLTLPNGDVVTRNPNSIIIMTSNADYAGCQMLNESVISRMHMVENLDFLTVEEMVDRAKSIFGDALEDEYYKAMASVVKNVENWIASDDENMGIASFREYQNWIELTLKTASSDTPSKKELIESAESTIKFKASQIKANLDNGFEICYQPLQNF